LSSDSYGSPAPAPALGVAQSRRPSPPPSLPPGSPPPGSRRPPGSTPPSQRTALYQLVAVILVIIAAAVVLHEVAVLVVIAALIAMIMVHELGHFVVAKRSGMKVTEFFLGFGPRLWSVRRGETEYGVKAIPAGGYNRILGMTSSEEVDPVDEPRTYRQATFPRRFAVAVAGTVMHFVMAFLLLYAFVAFIGLPVDNATQVASIATFSSGSSPAAAAGLHPGDIFVSADGTAITSLEQLTSIIESHVNGKVDLVVRRGGRLVTLVVTPADGRKVTEIVDGQPVKVRAAGTPLDKAGIIGVSLQSPAETSGLLDSVVRAGALEGRLTAQVGVSISQVFSVHGLSALGHDIASSKAGAASASPSTPSGAVRPSSIVGVVQIASQAAQQNVGELLEILALVNLVLGMLNMFPMLPFDGGHVVIAVYERIRSRRGKRYYVDIQKLMPVAYLTLAFIVIFTLGVLYLDIVHPEHLSG
jgi:membrane-associated protease RseP (regulator of RpoE activity)